MGIYGVIDAFGGVGIGDELVKFLKHEIPKGISFNQSDPERTLSFYFDPLRPIEVNALFNLILELNRKTWELNQKKSFYQRAGASLGLILQVGEVLHMISVGATSLHLLRDKTLQEVIPAANFRLFEQDNIPVRYQMDSIKMLNLPRTSIGLNLNLEIQWNPLRIMKNDIIILCSDGVLLDPDLKSLLRSIPERESQTAYLQNIVDKAFDYSNNMGNVDNQTMLLLEY